MTSVSFVRPDALDLAPVAPHLRGSAVLRMVQEEGDVVAPRRTVGVAPQWPPPAGAALGSHNFMAKCARQGGREVEWPPRGADPSIYLSNPTLKTQLQPQPQEAGSEPNLTTTYPSNFKLRNEMPIQQEGAKVFPSQPAFKRTMPMKMRGDSKWPPAGTSLDEPQEVREFIKPKKQNKDYSGFFAQHQLPASYTGYRAPPGTQHVGYDEGEDATDM